MQSHIKNLSFAGAIITLGIIFGDIGTQLGDAFGALSPAQQAADAAASPAITPVSPTDIPGEIAQGWNANPQWLKDAVIAAPLAVGTAGAGLPANPRNGAPAARRRGLRRRASAPHAVLPPSRQLLDTRRRGTLS